MPSQRDRGKLVRNHIGLVLYLAGGWRTYHEIANEFGWAISLDNRGYASRSKTAYRNIRALEEAGLPVEYEEGAVPRRMRLPSDWVARTPWLRRYIIRRTPLNAPAYRRSSHK